MSLIETKFVGNIFIQICFYHWVKKEEKGSQHQ